MSLLRRLRWPAGLAALVFGVALAVAAVAHAQTPREAPIPVLDSPVVDTTGTLDAASRATLEKRARDLQRRKGSQLQILVVTSTQPEDIAQYTQRVFDAWKLGRKGVDDGVLLVVAKDDHRVRIQTGYGLEGAIPDVLAGRIIQEYLVPKFRAGDFAGGIDDASQQLVRLVDGESLPPPMGDDAQMPSAMSDDSTQDQSGQSYPVRAPRSESPWFVYGALLLWFVVRGLTRHVPTLLRGSIMGALAGGLTWWILSIWPPAILIGLIGFILGLSKPGDRVASGGRWGSISSRSDDWSSGSGGGWSGGGGSSGGGGASGSW